MKPFWWPGRAATGIGKLRSAPDFAQASQKYCLAKWAIATASTAASIHCNRANLPSCSSILRSSRSMSAWTDFSSACTSPRVASDVSITSDKMSRWALTNASAYAVAMPEASSCLTYLRVSKVTILMTQEFTCAVHLVLHKHATAPEHRFRRHQNCHTRKVRVNLFSGRFRHSREGGNPEDTRFPPTRE